MNKDLLPRSSATNAYDLLLDVIRAVEEEPRRLWMDVVLATDETDESGEPLYDERPYAGFPACGTVGCIAGWISCLAGRSHPDVDDLKEAVKIILTDEQRRQPLLVGDGETMRRQLGALFFEEFPDGSCDSCGGEIRYTGVQQGTPEYVAHVVARIRAFMARWETELRAKAVTCRTSA